MTTYAQATKCPRTPGANDNCTHSGLQATHEHKFPKLTESVVLGCKFCPLFTSPDWLNETAAEGTNAQCLHECLHVQEVSGKPAEDKYSDQKETVMKYLSTPLSIRSRSL
jgi:hypothetical protein